MTYEYALEKHDYSRIDKLNTLHNTDTFWDDVRKFTRTITSSHGESRWTILVEARWRELNGITEEE